MLPGVVYQSRIAPDGSAQVEYMSDAARWMLECDPADVVADAQVFRRMIHPEDREKFLKSVQERCEGTGSWQHQYRLLLPSGVVRWVSSQASVERLPDGVSLWRGFMTDISAQHESAAAFERSAHMLSRTQRIAGMGTWTIEFAEPGVSDDATDALWWSDESYRLMGLEPGSVKPSSALFFELVHGEDRECVRQVTDEAISQGRDYSVEFRATLPGGEVRYFSEVVEIVFDDLGRAKGLVGSLLDITERKHAQLELDAERERLALATRAGNIGTWDYDMRAGTILWNDSMYAIHGQRREEFQPDPASTAALIEPAELEDVRRAYRESVTSGADRYMQELQIVRPDGERRLIRSQAVILRAPKGHAIRMVGIAMDVTEEKRSEAAMERAREAAEAAARSKSEFLATMSHEIRTPMNGVLGYAEMLRSTRLDAEQREYLDTIAASGEHLLAIVNDVLDVSRIEAGGVQIELAPFDARACVKAVFEMLRPVAGGKGLGYFCEIDPAMPGGMISDQGRVAQILTNVLGNAIKFTDAGSVKLSAAASRTEADGGWLWTFRVSDTGPGIAPEAMDRIFQPFYQADGSAARRHGGTGLGLTISRRLAELLDGTLDVRNLPEGGCEFLLALRAGVPAEVAEAREDTGDFHRLRGRRVLVVEDNPVNRRLCELQLRRLGCEAEFAVDGLEALVLERGRKFDAVLMDMQLPGLDGCGATREIRRREELAGGRTPIIAMTANARAEDRQRCLDAGMDDHLTKPLRQQTLGAALDKWINAQAGASR